MEFLNANSIRQEHDFYATPPWEVENILQYERLEGTILDPCCGTGCISSTVKKYYPNNVVIATDMYNYNLDDKYGYNFLDNSYPYTENIDSIIMNPPYSLINEFITKSLMIVKKKIILLARLQILEGKNRYKNIFLKHPPFKVYIYVDRIWCYKNGDFTTKQISNAMTYCWIIFEKDFYSDPTIKFLRRSNKQRYERGE